MWPLDTLCRLKQTCLWSRSGSVCHPCQSPLGLLSTPHSDLFIEQHMLNKWYQEAHVTTCLQGSFHWAVLIQSHLLHSSDHTPELPEEIGCTKQPHCLRKCYPFLQAKMRGHFSWQCFKVHCLTKKQFLKGLPPILHPKKKKMYSWSDIV